MRASCVCKLRQIVSLMPISLMLCALFVGAFPGVASASPEKGSLALEPQTIEVEKGKETNVCPDWPFFDVKVMISNVTYLSGVAVSVHWNTSLLNCTMPDRVTPGFTPGDFLPVGPPDATGWYMVWYFDAGNMSDCGNSMLIEKPLISVPDTEWRWVFTLTFEYIGPSPAIGYSPKETDIIIVNQPDADMPTYWCEAWGPSLDGAYHDFEPYPEPVPGKPWMISTCRLHYEIVETLTHEVTVDTETFYVVTESNSAVSNLTLDETYTANDWRGEISFNVTGLTGTSGFCNITIPKNLMDGGELWRILVDGVETTCTSSDNVTHTFLYIEYTHSTRKVQIYGTWVIPEFPAFMFPLLLMIATIAAVIASKKVWSIRRKGRIIAE